MASSKFTNFVMYIVLLITFLGIINMIFNLHRFAFYGEFMILLVLFPVAIISAVGASNSLRWAWITLMLIFAFVFIDILFIYVISTVKVQYFLLLLVVATVGFFISLFNIKNPKKEFAKTEVENEKSGINVEKIEAEKTYDVNNQIKKTYKPGKYIASKLRGDYHVPKCDWAKKIHKNNAVWFKNDSEAKKSGYTAHDCIK